MKYKDMNNKVDEIIKKSFLESSANDWNEIVYDFGSNFDSIFLPLLKELIFKEKDKLLFDLVVIKHFRSKVFFDLSSNFNDTLHNLKTTAIEFINNMNEAV